MRIKSPEIMRIIVTAEYISLCEVTPMDKIQISSDFSYVYLYLYVCTSTRVQASIVRRLHRSPEVLPTIKLQIVISPRLQLFYSQLLTLRKNAPNC